MHELTLKGCLALAKSGVAVAKSSSKNKKKTCRATAPPIPQDLKRKQFAQPANNEPKKNSQTNQLTIRGGQQVVERWRK